MSIQTLVRDELDRNQAVEFPDLPQHLQMPTRRRRLMSRRNWLIGLLVVIGISLNILAVVHVDPIGRAASPVLNTATAHKWAASMLRLVNHERASHGLTHLRMNVRLTRSAHSHDLAMARAHTMSHQLPGEAFFATRITRTGYNWRSVGENIGYNTLQSKAALRSLERQMYRETAPNNGHRLNIVSRPFRDIGIDVYFDKAHRTMWFTQDFGQHM